MRLAEAIAAGADISIREQRIRDPTPDVGGHRSTPLSHVKLNTVDSELFVIDMGKPEAQRIGQVAAYVADVVNLFYFKARPDNNLWSPLAGSVSACPSYSVLCFPFLVVFN